jgi:PAS domain S-box-containing protein
MLEQQEKNSKQSYSSDHDRYKTLFESINAAAFITSIDGKILEANLKSCDLFGYGWEDLKSLSLKNIFSDKTDWSQLIEEITSKGGMNFESENKRKDGSIFPVVIDTSMFQLDRKPVLLVLIWDITNRKCAEEKIRASEERYRCIFENSAVAIMLTDKNENIISWNKYTETLLGYEKDELKNKPVKMLYPTNEWEKIRAENIRQKGMKHHLETKMYRKNGELTDVDISLSVLKDEKDSVTGSIGVIKDITERKKAERQIRESEEKFRGLFDFSTDGMLILDSRGEIIDVNSQTLKFFGLAKEKMIGNNLLNMRILTPKSNSIVVNQFQNLLFNKIAPSKETEVIDKDGKIVDVELTSFFLLKKQNEVNNFVLLIRDIRDRKQAEIKLSREHSFLQTLMNSSPDSIYFKDDQNRFIKVNKTKAAHSNVKTEDMIGKTDYDFLPEDEAKKSFEDDEEILKTGKFIINKIEKLTGIDGSERWVSVTKIPRFDAEGNIIGTMGISRDITEWKRLEEHQNKDNNP